MRSLTRSSPTSASTSATRTRCGTLAVGRCNSEQWAVGSGQWAVGSGSERAPGAGDGRRGLLLFCLVPTAHCPLPTSHCFLSQLADRGVREVRRDEQPLPSTKKTTFPRKD